VQRGGNMAAALLLSIEKHLKFFCLFVCRNKQKHLDKPAVLL
jgi:hypothetical protein